MSKKIVVFTGAGMSADSGLSTFRDADGLWDRYRIEDVCTPEALAKNRQLVIDFYNIRRKELLSKEPNAGHLAIRRLEDYFVNEKIPASHRDEQLLLAGEDEIFWIVGGRMAYGTGISDATRWVLEITASNSSH